MYDPTPTVVEGLIETSCTTGVIKTTEEEIDILKAYPWSSLSVTSGLKGEESESMRRVRAEAEWNRKVNAVVKELQLVKTREKKAQTTISALQSSEVALKGRLLLTEKQNREIKNRLATEEAKYRRV
ncbi:hypothetical protein ADUPG1_010987, partial [Aduncisulcus paluster]